jgi:hypothetical protein
MRFNVIWSYAVQVFVAWDTAMSDDSTRGTLNNMGITATSFNFWNHDSGLTVDMGRGPAVAALTNEDNRMPIANLCMNLGTSIQDEKSRDAQKGVKPSSERLVAAHMVVYASWVIAACAAESMNRGQDDNNQRLVYTYDLYAASIWTCFALRQALDSLPGDAPTTWTFKDVMAVLRLAYAKEKFTKEIGLNGWQKVPVMGGNLGYFIRQGAIDTTNSAIVLPGENGVGSTFNFTTISQAGIAESLFSRYMDVSMYTWPVTEIMYMTRVAYVPLFINEVINDTEAKNDFVDEWLPYVSTAQDLFKTIYTLESRYGAIVCGSEVTACNALGADYYWDEDAGVCKKIANDPDGYCKYRNSKDSTVGPIWDPTTKSCVFPKPGPTPRETCNATPGFHWEGDDATGKCVPDTPPGPTPREKCNATAGFHWEGDDATGKCVPDTPPKCPTGEHWDGTKCVPDTDPDEEKKKCALLPDHHWDDASGTCVKDTEEDKCNKRKAAGEDVVWDGTNCLKRVTPIIPTPTPSGGGGGGGGGGGSGPALFIGILALLALFGRR